MRACSSTPCFSTVVSQVGPVGRMRSLPTVSGSAGISRSKGVPYGERVMRDSALHASIVMRLRAAGCVFAEDEADVLFSTRTEPPELDAMVTRRAKGAPLEQVVGWAEFAGLRIVVHPG